MDLESILKAIKAANNFNDVQVHPVGFKTGKEATSTIKIGKH